MDTLITKCSDNLAKMSDRIRKKHEFAKKRLEGIRKDIEETGDAFVENIRKQERVYSGKRLEANPKTFDITRSGAQTLKKLGSEPFEIAKGEIDRRPKALSLWKKLRDGLNLRYSCRFFQLVALKRQLRNELKDKRIEMLEDHKKRVEYLIEMLSKMPGEKWNEELDVKDMLDAHSESIGRYNVDKACDAFKKIYALLYNGERKRTRKTIYVELLGLSKTIIEEEIARDDRKFIGYDSTKAERDTKKLLFKWETEVWKDLEEN